MNTVALSPGNGSQPGPDLVVPPASKVRVAPIPTPQASSPRLRGTQASNAGDCVPPPSIPGESWNEAYALDPAFLAATRESQGQPVDAIPRIGDWPFTVNREGWLIDMRDGSIAYDMMAQLGLGIGRV